MSFLFNRQPLVPVGTPQNAIPRMGGPMQGQLPPSAMPSALHPAPMPAPTGLGSLAPRPYAEGGRVIALAEGGKVAVGPGGGLDDLIPTTIDGHELAALSDGEFVVPADVVSMMGDGSTKAGSERLYDLVRQIRQAKTGTDEQAQPLQFADILRNLA